PFYKRGIDIAGPFSEGPEIGMPTYRTAAVDVVYNDEEIRLNLDLLEERRKRVAIRDAKAKLKIVKNQERRKRVAIRDAKAKLKIVKNRLSSSRISFIDNIEHATK
nr:reverse transcriptase domain-containing protein [Tanacetum cinerariifolium]